MSPGSFSVSPREPGGPTDQTDGPDLRAPLQNPPSYGKRWDDGFEEAEDIRRYGTGVAFNLAPVPPTTSVSR